MKEALKGLLSFFAPGMLDAHGVVWMCSGGMAGAIIDGNHHGVVTLDWNFYRAPCKFMYHIEGMPEK